uniref:M24 family metallopeptidase n=1 Tax=Thermoflexus sp. TaxID=1969742 RepID=UPI002ADE01E9
DEIAAMRRAVAVAEAALRMWLPEVRIRMTEREAARRLIQACFAAGADALAFEPIVVAGPSAALPHATPSDRPLGPGELMIVDFGVVVDGYVSDLTRTFALGEPDPELRRVYEVVREANAAGRAAVRPGIPAEAVDWAARAVIEAAGYGPNFLHRTGHGLGLEVHEPPYIVAGNTAPLQPGMTFTVEPGIYLPGKGGVRIEDDVVVTETGGESLTTFPRELMSIGE